MDRRSDGTCIQRSGMTFFAFSELRQIMLMRKDGVRVVVAALVMVGIGLGLVSCRTEQSPSERRAQRAEKATGEIVIGIVNAEGNYSFRLGAELAMKEINQRGGILGRPLHALWYDDANSPDKALAISKQFARNHDVIAVIGHSNSPAAISASITYFENGILFITPATDPNLTRYGFWTTFRTNLMSDASGQQLAQFAASQNFNKMVVLYNRGEADKKLAESFHATAVKTNVKIVATRSYFETDRDFRSMLAGIADVKPDAIFLAGTLPTAATVMNQAREIGIMSPFIGGDGLDSLNLLYLARRAAEGTIVPTAFSPEYPAKATQDFVDRFEASYGIAPSTWDAQGYDAVYLLETAIQKSGSTVPLSLSTTLHFLKNWEGVAGLYSFTPVGELQDRKLFFKVVKNGKFEFASSEGTRMAQIDPLKVIEDITIRLPLEHRIDSLDPGLSAIPESYEVIEQLFLGLTDFDPGTYDAMPELAENWTVSEDGLVYQFHLREGVTWTDGTPVTAQDVVWTLRRNLDPKTKSPNVSRLYLLKNARALHQGELSDPAALGVRAIDDLIVEFTLESPAVYFPKLLDLPVYRPLPRLAIEAHPDSWTLPENIQTNGAYQLSVLKKGVILVLRKNPDYYDAQKVSIPEIRYYIISNPVVGLAMYNNNELDVLGSSYLPVPVSEIPLIRSHPTLRQEYSQQQKSCTNVVLLNPIAPLNHLFVRRAIASVIDRKFILDFVLRGDGDLANVLLPPGITGGATQRAGVNLFYPEHGPLWLAKAGYSGEQKVPALTITCPSASPYQEIAQILRDTLDRQLGIATECVTEADAKQRPPHIILMRKCADYPDASSFLEDFHPDDQPKIFQWPSEASAAKFADLLARARTQTEPLARSRLYSQAELMLLQSEVLMVPLYFEVAPSLVKPRVTGWHHNILGGQYIQNWQFQK